MRKEGRRNLEGGKLPRAAGTCRQAGRKPGARACASSGEQAQTADLDVEERVELLRAACYLKKRLESAGFGHHHLSVELL